MKLYHGTSEIAWKAIREAGAIQPRRIVGTNNWAHNDAPSHPDAVYLTDVYAGYFAICALDELPDDTFPRAAVIEIDVPQIVDWLVPDEDALEQSTRDRTKGRFTKADMIRRTAAARGKLKGLVGTDAWQDSLAYMGTCAHMGPVPLDAITRVALLDIREHAQWAWSNLQPLVSAANYRLCGDQYRTLTAQAFEIGEVAEFNFLENKT